MYMIDDILFVHPNDMQQSRIAIQDTNIITKVKSTAPEKN